MYSIVIPCYNSSKSIRQVVEETSAKMTEMGRTPFEFVLVDDYSPDEGATVRKLHAVADDYPYVKVIELALNSGQHNATMAGLTYTSGDVIISMDDDLQTHPSQLPKLFEEFDKGYDIVYGYYPEKKHSGFRNFGSWVNHETVRILIGKPKDMKTSSFWIIRKFVRDNVIKYKAKYPHLQGLFLRTTANISSVPVEHFERVYGKSNYTLKKLIGLWFNISGFSIVPLKIALRLGAVTAFIGLISLFAVILNKIMRPTVPMGWASTMCTTIFFAGIILMTLGLVGEYIGRIFLTQGNDPQFVIRDVYTSEDKKSNSSDNNTEERDQ